MNEQVRAPAQVQLLFYYQRWNAMQSLMWTIGTLVLGMPSVWGFVHHVPLLAQHSQLIGMTCGVLLLGMISVRDALRIDETGIYFRRYWWGVVPVKKLVFGLDATVDDYWPLECDEPEGISIRWRSPAAGGKEMDTECFGPSGKLRVEALLLQVRAAIVQARAAAAESTLSLRSDLLQGQHRALDLAWARRNDHGRIVEIDTLAPVQIGALTLPPRTKLRFNGEDYIDPRRGDVLISALLTEPGVLDAELVGRAGTELTFYARGNLQRIRHGAAGTLHRAGFAFDTEQTMVFEEDGLFVSGALASPHLCGAVVLPVGTRLSARSYHGVGAEDATFLWDVGESVALRTGFEKRRYAQGWRLQLKYPLQLPELLLQPGDVLQANGSCTALQGLLSARRIVWQGGSFAPKNLSLPLLADGRVDSGPRFKHFRSIMAKIEKSS